MADASPRLRDFRALTFDCYGTLIDWESGLRDFLLPWLRARGATPPAGEVLELFARLESALESSHPTLAYRQLLRRLFIELGSHYGLTVDADDADALPASLSSWPPFADAAPFLARARSSHVLAIISNVDDELFAASQAALGVELDAVITAQAVGAYKPSPVPFERALARLGELGVPAAATLHIAQSLYHDHVPAQRLGLASCWVDRRAGRRGFGATLPPEVEVEPDFTVRSLAELMDRF